MERRGTKGREEKTLKVQRQGNLTLRCQAEESGKKQQYGR